MTHSTQPRRLIEPISYETFSHVLKETGSYVHSLSVQLLSAQTHNDFRPASRSHDPINASNHSAMIREIDSLRTRIDLSTRLVNARYIRSEVPLDTLTFLKKTSNLLKSISDDLSSPGIAVSEAQAGMPQISDDRPRTESRTMSKFVSGMLSAFNRKAPALSALDTLTEDLKKLNVIYGKLPQMKQSLTAYFKRLCLEKENPDRCLRQPARARSGSPYAGIQSSPFVVAPGAARMAARSNGQMPLRYNHQDNAHNIPPRGVQAAPSSTSTVSTAVGAWLK